jgi:hypothetical protein
MREGSWSSKAVLQEVTLPPVGVLVVVAGEVAIDPLLTTYRQVVVDRRLDVAFRDGVRAVHSGAGAQAIGASPGGQRSPGGVCTGGGGVRQAREVSEGPTCARSSSASLAS